MSYTISKLIPEDELREGIKKVAERINNDYGDKDVHLVCVLKGGVYFLTELSKYLKMNVSIDFMSVSSYGSSTVSSGVVKIIKDLDEPIKDKNVIVVEDIVDTGNTLSYLISMLKDREPASIKLCTMLDKPSRREKDIDADYTAFTIPDKFVLGFGLDFDQKYRNLPYIGVVEFDEQ
ncbi:MAG: hypoxanthine phosphoribosyltransferase [Eubacteriales bacterium]|nr:hypoxanthine phosphoribosyltransferase [Eubacteriales bacterium]